MIKVDMINNESEFLEHTQIIKLLKDQMEYIGSPKTNQEIMNTIRLSFQTQNTKLMVINDNGHVLGFCFFNISIGMESNGKYLWLNEMHIHSEYRGKGYGTLLFNELTNWCKDNNIVKIMGIVEESEVRTLDFYKKQGVTVNKEIIFSKEL